MVPVLVAVVLVLVVAVLAGLVPVPVSTRAPPVPPTMVRSSSGSVVRSRNRRTPRSVTAVRPNVITLVTVVTVVPGAASPA
ncbi:hypothetical protein [Streptomyces spiralis]|uniref:hypothetical protein n=1 Tax=Streptomyces spiralis TaxID=66376 RepID=UPI00167BDDF5|nr:hypothetical protein [Streptomyces spiralis]